MLAGRDSNPDYQGQNLACCRYTTRQKGRAMLPAGCLGARSGPEKEKLPSPVRSGARPESSEGRLQSFHSAPAAISRNASDPREVRIRLKLTRIDRLPPSFGGPSAMVTRVPHAFVLAIPSAGQIEMFDGLGQRM